MSLLTLENIGKIYARDGNVAVGIRGVNLSFDKGEFVAVTGKSGSGKSTLLNVISGMDTYEEGELYIDGKPTSHYVQSDWEQYRQKYISFIFQDYNIIESFTVLQNVELALMYIDDAKERRARAVELLNRVGLGDRLRQKGSKLSGGQKQRTVIARALAKDSPIILADEPTGNLDSKTSEEIIELLREISENKLVIVVTHSFEQLESCATRHIRIFDGAVESDHPTPYAKTTGHVESTDEKPAVVESVQANSGTDGAASPTSQACEQTKKQSKRFAELKKGFTLGRVVFAAKPKLSAFMCMLLIIGILAVFFVTSACGEISVLFKKHYMFEHIDGRTVVTTQTGEVLQKSETTELIRKYGAQSYLPCDILLDKGDFVYNAYSGRDDYSIELKCAYGAHYGDASVGSYPSKKNEILLYLPIWCQKYYGKNTLKKTIMSLYGVDFKISGVKYFYDNTKTAEILFTDEGFRIATAAYYFDMIAVPAMKASLTKNGKVSEWMYNGIIPSFEVDDDKIYIDEYAYRTLRGDGVGSTTELAFSAVYNKYDYGSSQSIQKYELSILFTDEDLTAADPSRYDGTSRSKVYFGTSLLCDIADMIYSESYRQISMFFDSDKTARAAARQMRDDGYVAVTSDTTYEPSIFETIVDTLTGVFVLAMWLAAIVFLAFFVNLCSRKSIGAFKSDMAIMRSMGIPVKIVRIGVYVRMLISLVPAYLFLIAAALVVYLTPALNGLFGFLHAWQYIFIFFGQLLLTLFVTLRQMKKLFDESVKKSLKGDRE